MLNFSDALLSNARARASTAKGYSQDYRMGKNTYDCSSFVGRNLKDLGFNINPGITTANLTPDSQMMRKLGFQWVPKGQGFQAGDILWKKGHTEIYSGGRNTIGAHSTKNGVSEYNKQDLNSFAGGWRYVGDRFLGGAGTQGADKLNSQGTAVAQGMADPAVQQAVMPQQAYQQAYRPTVVVQAPQEAPAQGFQAYVPQIDYSQTSRQMFDSILGQLAQSNAQAQGQMASRGLWQNVSV